jgi:tRNA-2-methylthio-N6-dimethylallyladenosine synthase
VLRQIPPLASHFCIASAISISQAFSVGRRVCIQTFGCQMNERDSETMAAVLRTAGHEIVAADRPWDVAILNSCSVRDGAELKVLGRLQRLVLGKGKKWVGVAGCMAQRLGNGLFQRIPGLDFVVGTRQFARIGEVLERLERGENQVTLLGEDAAGGEGGQRRWEVLQPTAFVTVATGCPMACSYCIVPQTRGRHFSRPGDHILGEVRLLAERGTKEIVLLGQIVNYYGLRQFPFVRRKSPFVQLLEQIHGVDGIARIRFLSPHPCGFREDFFQCLREFPKLCPAIHLPIQSGSDRILRHMRRGYTRTRVLEIIHRLRQQDPSISISTDLIVGYPGETDGDFQATESLFDAVDFDMAYIFQFSPRTGTPAAQMGDQIPDSVAGERNQVLLRRLASSSLRRNGLFLQTTQPVLVERPSQKDLRILVGHTPHQKKVFFPGGRDRVGQIIPVAIGRATVSALHGEPLPSGK